ncbi:MAG: xylulokinase [Candidatus Hydrogenedentota bacterium]
MSESLLAIDIGATGIKAGVFDTNGHVHAVAGRRNGPVPDTLGQPGWLVWDPEAVWNSVCECIRECVAASDCDVRSIRAVATTGFGADGLPMDAGGNPLYPFISWHCGRTALQCEQIARSLGNENIFQITGYHNYPINTANRLLWFRQKHPEILDKASTWLQVQDYIAFRLSGECATDCTIASTTMLLDGSRRDWSDTMLHAAGVDRDLLPPLRESGTSIGRITAEAAAQTGLSRNTQVITGGHDCEIGVLGAGVSDPQTFIDISGTWEILIALSNNFDPKPDHYIQGLDFECHAVPGQWICQSLMIAGGVMEWIRDKFYAHLPEGEVYAAMIAEANVPSRDIYVLPSFMRGMGPDASRHATGTILGLTTATTRGQIVRAAFEGLCFQLRQQTQALSAATGKVARKLRVIGGGQKNPLWMQMKADTTGLPVEITQHPEVTLLGAAILAGVGAGLYSSAHDAMRQIPCHCTLFEPEATAAAQYADRFTDVYARLATDLQHANEAIARHA